MSSVMLKAKPILIIFVTVSVVTSLLDIMPWIAFLVLERILSTFNIRGVQRHFLMPFDLLLTLNLVWFISAFELLVLQCVVFTCCEIIVSRLRTDEDV